MAQATLARGVDTYTDEQQMGLHQGDSDSQEAERD